MSNCYIFFCFQFIPAQNIHHLPGYLPHAPFPVLFKHDAPLAPVHAPAPVHVARAPVVHAPVAPVQVARAPVVHAQVAPVNVAPVAAQGMIIMLCTHTMINNE